MEADVAEEANKAVPHSVEPTELMRVQVLLLHQILSRVCVCERVCVCVRA